MGMECQYARVGQRHQRRQRRSKKIRQAIYTLVNNKGQRIYAFKNTAKDEKMDKLKDILHWILHPIKSYKERQEFKKRIEELRKRDPFIYK